MMRMLLKRYGPLVSTLAVTLVAVLGSVMVKAVLLVGFKGRVDALGIAMAAIVPVLVATPLAAYLVGTIMRLERAEERLRRLATVDDLTQVFNRGHFMGLAADEVARARRHQIPLSILMLDVDRFKAINDTHGHLTGDRVLQALACCCARQIRHHDVLARFGGEEFVFLLPQTGAAEAAVLAERVRAAVERDRVACGGAPVSFTVSIGVAAMNDWSMTLDEVIRAADQALYAAKARGRNQVVLAPV